MAERYEIRGRLGRGGMSAVYRAFDSIMGREVAIKRLLPIEETNLNEDAGDVLASEAAALAKFQHPNIVTVFAFEEDDEGPYVVMELVDGMDLHEVLQDGAFSLEDFEDIAIQCLEPLASAAELNLLHRDIKPGNIMLTMTASERFLVKILDFGLAKFSQQPSTQTLDQAGSFLGSIDYIAPEQLELLPLDQRTDLYSLGCVLYYALAQKSPFTGENPAETSMNHLNHAVVPIGNLRPDLSEPVASWLMSMIARDPDNRPANALEALGRFREALAQVAEEVPVAIAVPEEPTVAKGPRILTGSVAPIPHEAAGTGAVNRPVLNTSPQAPRSAKTGAVASGSTTRSINPGSESILRNPILVTTVGVVLLAILLFTLFRGRTDPQRSVEREEELVEQIAFPAEPEPAVAPAFKMPDPFALEGDPKPQADLPGDPLPLLRFSATEGTLDTELNPVAGDMREVGIWVNLQTRGKWRSLYPLAGDSLAERLPFRALLRPGQISALKNVTASLAFGDHAGLVTRTGALPLENGFTVFFVGRMERGSGRQVFLEPNAGGGALASLSIDFSGNVIGASRMGAAMKEFALDVPWNEAGVGVIGYGCSPAQGTHRLLGQSASSSGSRFNEGSFESQSSPFQKLIVGQHDAEAYSGSPESMWMMELLLYDELLPQGKMKEVAQALARFHFKLPDS